MEGTGRSWIPVRWRLALAAGIVLVALLAPVLAVALQGRTPRCTQVAACITGNPAYDQHRPCLDPGAQPPPRPLC